MEVINRIMSYVFVILFLFTTVSMAFSWAPIAVADNIPLSVNPLVNSTAYPQNITVHTGDLILTNNDVLLIKDAQLNLKGNLRMNGNSTLILDNGTLYPDFGKGQFSYTLHDNAKITMQKGSDIESLIFDFILYDNSSINILDSKLSQNIRLDSINATLQAVNSSIRVATIYGDSSFINSSLSDLNFYGNARIVNSHIEQFEVSSLYRPIHVDLVNSTYDRVNTDFIGQGVIRVYWYLTVLVESQGTPVQDAIVQIYAQANNSLVAEQNATSEGKAQFELPALEISEHGETQTSEYTIRVNQNQTQVQENVTLNASMEKTVSLSADLQIIIFAVIAVIVILVVVVFLIFLFRKKRKQ
ncbi:MAG: hypothetical protein ACM3UY_07465 [Methanocella sp.]